MPALFFLLSLLGAQGDAPPSAPRNRALIVAINEYQHAAADGSWQNLAGCVNDAHLARDLLVDRFGFAPDSVKLLVDQQATHESIVRAFYDWLIVPSGPDTEAVFWFSGHGSQVPDASGYSGAEADQRDSSYLAYDSRLRGAATCFDISDDEIYSLVRALSERTPRATLITDSCHSGGGVRGVTRRNVRRAAEEGQNPITHESVKAFWPPIPFLDDGDSGRAQPISYVHLAACAYDEVALEYELSDTSGAKVAHGAFTFFLTQALQHLQPGSTYEQLGREVAARVVSEGDQHVQVEGQRHREVFSSRFAAPPPGFDGQIEKDGRIHIKGGALHQLRRGCVFELTDLWNKPIGKARLDQVTFTSSSASWLGLRPALGEITAIRAIEVDRPSAERPFVVIVPAGDALHDRVAQSLAAIKSPKVTVVRAAAAVVDYELGMPSGGTAFALTTVPDGVLLWSEPKTIDGDRVEDLVDGLRAKLTQEVYYRALLKIAGARGRVPMAIALEPSSEEQLAALGAKDRGELAPARIERRRARGLMESSQEQVVVYDRPAPVRDVATITIQMQEREGDSRRQYLSVFCVSDNHEVTLLTGTGDASPCVRPGDLYPKQIEVYTDMTVERPSRDRYVVIATSEPADFSMFESRKVATRGANASPSTDELSNGIPSPIQQAIDTARQKSPTRGVGGVITSVDYGVATMDVLIAAERR